MFLLDGGAHPNRSIQMRCLVGKPVLIRRSGHEPIAAAAWRQYSECVNLPSIIRKWVANWKEEARRRMWGGNAKKHTGDNNKSGEAYVWIPDDDKSTWLLLLRTIPWPLFKVIHLTLSISSVCGVIKLKRSLCIQWRNVDDIHKSYYSLIKFLSDQLRFDARLSSFFVAYS